MFLRGAPAIYALIGFTSFSRFTIQITGLPQLYIVKCALFFGSDFGNKSPQNPNVSLDSYNRPPFLSYQNQDVRQPTFAAPFRLPVNFTGILFRLAYYTKVRVFGRSKLIFQSRQIFNSSSYAIRYQKYYKTTPETSNVQGRINLRCIYFLATIVFFAGFKSLMR